MGVILARVWLLLAAAQISRSYCGPVSVVVDGSSALATTSDHYLCWNIDASRNREFFDRDLSVSKPFGAQLARQAKAISQRLLGKRSVLRFGGTGNDYLTYEFGGTACPPPGNPIKECMNTTWWSNLLGFARAADAVIVFGVSLNTDHDSVMGSRGDKRWDPTNAKQILQWTIEQGDDDLIYGLELGNEQDKEYTGKQQALDLQILHNLTLELWPDASRRPVLLGPDAHGLHGGQPGGQQDAKDKKMETWIKEYMQAVGDLGMPLHGATLHEYIEVNNSTFLDGNVLDRSLSLQTAFKRAVDGGWTASKAMGPAPRPWGGEIGPHNGGSPPCAHSSMRWANFGTAIWYIDALSLSAQVGYEAFCRQDFIGADYGLCDCSTGAPLPSYWAALLWTSFMGQDVLPTPIVQPVCSVRAYAHCSASSMASSGAVSVILINLGLKAVKVMIHFKNFLRAGSHRSEYLFTAVDKPDAFTNATGLLGAEAALNGHILQLAPDGEIPDLASFGRNVSGADPVHMEAHSVAFLLFAGYKAQACDDPGMRIIRV